MPHVSEIQVFFRFRPLSISERLNNEVMIWKTTRNSVSLDMDLLMSYHDPKKVLTGNKTYFFSNLYSDECFAFDDCTEKVYQSAVKPLVNLVLEGYNGTIFAYGQTGTGKTYTMIGSEDPGKSRKKRSFSPSLYQPATFRNKGVLLLSMEDIFEISSKSGKLHTISCSFFEIHNENINDLLASGENLSINEDPVKGFYVKNLSEHPVRTSEDIIELLNIGENSKKYRETDLNRNSSRSHTIFTVNIIWMRECNCYESLINFVDLAGAERIMSHKKNSSSEVLTESKHINTSLFYLCQVICKLAEKQTNQHMHVPYRNSNLTKILRNSIGGNSITSIICTASPCGSSYEMTQSTLHLASLAKTIVNKPVVNMRTPSTSELMKIYHSDIKTLTLQAQVKNQSKLRKNTQKNCEFCNARRIDWISGVGDLEVKNLIRPYDDKKLLKKIENLNGKIVDLQSQIEPVEMKNSILLQTVSENFKAIEEKNKLLAKNEKRYWKILEYVKGLKKKIAILEGRELQNMTVSEIVSLEKFYFELIDEAKNVRISRGNNSVLKETICPFWSNLEISFPSTPLNLSSPLKENQHFSVKFPNS